LDCVRRNQILIVLVHRIPYAVTLQSKHMKAALEFTFDHELDDVVHGIVHALDHAGENKSGLNHVLIRVDADHKMSCATVDLSVLLDSIERPKSRITGSRENHIRAFTDLLQGQFFSLAAIVAGRISYAYVVLYDRDIRIHRLR